jgi:hypothetical protein
LFVDQKQPLEDIKKVEYHKEEQLLKVTFTIFFLGVGPNSNKLVQDVLKNPIADPINKAIISHLDTIANSHKKWPQTLQCQVQPPVGEMSMLTYRASYKPFQGHQGKLGHYFRHLYQLIKFVDSSEILTFEEKYDYVRIIRAQLSVYEQILIYYNSFASFGKVWIDQDYIVNYKLIKNIPIPLLDFGIRPKERFKEQIIKRWGSIDSYFEWDKSTKS